MRAQHSSRLMQCIGQRVRLYRMQAGITAKQLAACSGVTPLKILMFEEGTDTVSMNELMRIADGLDVTLGDLLRGVALYSPVHVWTVYPVKS
ncbi:MAG: helix-turn-helix transcriptional regulator [Ignavibacteriae bacterium]|nr:helix-turn-helix transcriptional regulator [Ignavibacteriota bacterium]MCB9215693.1 helix-turn-helix transcriptional regulator [Ignavibacteria bacterium]